MDLIEKKCLFCENENCSVEIFPANFTNKDLTPEVFSARRITEHFHYKIYKCKNTGLIYSKEILPEEQLKYLYKESKVTFNKYATLIAEDYWKPLSKQITNLKKESKILEIGCSNGFFLQKLFDLGYKNVYGCEPSTEAIELASDNIKKNIYCGFFNEETYPNNTFDLICIFQTLDHLENPIKMMEICHQKLKKNGLLYIIVHNTNALQYKLFKDKSPIIDIEHIYLFNKLNISKAIEKSGFTTKDIFNIKNTYPLEYLISHSPIPLKNIALKIINGLGISDLKISMNLGNMGIIGIKK
ncbi:MAG: class I SAM-dependent methyltransferase [Bacteroidota bacterium]